MRATLKDLEVQTGWIVRHQNAEMDILIADADYMVKVAKGYAKTLRKRQAEQVGSVRADNHWTIQTFDAGGDPESFDEDVAQMARTRALARTAPQRARTEPWPGLVVG